MRHIHVKLIPSERDLYDIPRDIVLLIDILRATSTLAAMFANGIKKVYPFSDLDILEKTYLEDRECYKAGEINGLRIKGFHFGNSPYEFCNLKYTKILFYTTNGTKLIRHIPCESKHIFALSFLNTKATVEKIEEIKGNILILCASDEGQVSIADTLCAGYFISFLENSKLSDSAKICFDFYRHQKNIEKTILDSYHAQKLLKYDFGREDILFCAQKDIYNFAIKYKKGYFFKL